MIFNILPEDKITSQKADTKFIKLDITHINCDEPFVEIYIHRDVKEKVIECLK